MQNTASKPPLALRVLKLCSDVLDLALDHTLPILPIMTAGMLFINMADAHMKIKFTSMGTADKPQNALSLLHKSVLQQIQHTNLPKAHVTKKCPWTRSPRASRILEDHLWRRW